MNDCRVLFHMCYICYHCSSMKNRFLPFKLLLLVLFLSQSLANAIDISGFVRDDASSEAVIHARVQIMSTDSTIDPVFTNTYGYFFMSVDDPKAVLKITALGYLEVKYTLSASDAEDKILDIRLSRDDYVIPEDVADVDRTPNALSMTTSGFIQTQLDVQKDLPVIASEADPIKAMQMLPGVEFGREGFSELFIRGGGSGQTLYLLDGIPVYGDNHAFGLLSTYNQNSIKNIDLYRGAFPSKYGGRLSGVVDITSHCGNQEESGGYAAISPGTIDVGINGGNGQNGSTKFGISARRSYMDLLLFPLFAQTGFKANFFDINFNLSTEISEKSTLEIHSLFARDVYNFGLDVGDSTSAVTLNLGWKYWSNVTSVRLNHIINKHHFGTFAVAYSGFSTSQTYKETVSRPKPNEPAITDVVYSTGNFDIMATGELEYKPNKTNTIRYGGQLIAHGFNTGRYTEETSDSIGRTISNETIGDPKPSYGLEFALYGEDEFYLSKNFLATTGVRVVTFGYDGNTKIYLEPRVSARIRLNKKSSIKLGYMRTNQFLHSLNNDGTEITTARWVPTTASNPAGKVDMFTAGYVAKISRSSTFQLEWYYKKLSNLYLIEDPTSIARLVNYRSSLVSGSGAVIGGEALIQKTMGNLTGFASYGVSKAERTFVELGGEDPFPFNFDRRQFFKAGIRYVLDQDYVFSFNIAFGSGLPYTLPNSLYRDVEGQLLLGYDQINNYRASAYRRIDVAIHRIQGSYGLAEQRLSLSLYNVLGSQNTSNVFFEQDTSVQGIKYNAYRNVTFVFIPGIRYEVRF